MDTRVESALQEVARREPDLADAVRAAWEDLTQGTGDAREVSQWWLQMYLWDILARRSDGSPQWTVRLARGLGDVLAAAGLGRYAELARSETTREVLLAVDDLEDWANRYAAALRASGIQPPDTDLITWGPVMGPAEADTYERVANALELSMVSGAHTAAGRGSRAVRTGLTDAVLTAPFREAAGLRPLHGIASERLAAWTDRSPVLAELAEPLREVLTSGVPDRLTGRPGDMPLLEALLAVLAEPVRLSARGYLPRDVVRAWAVTAGVDHHPSATSPEHQNPYLTRLRRVAQRTGLVRVHRGALALTVAGRAAASDPERLATAVADRWFGTPRDAEAVAREVLTLALAADGEAVVGDLARTVQQVYADEGWRTVSGAPDLGLCRHVLHESIEAGRVLRLLRTEPQDRVSATPVGTAVLRAALRHHLLHDGLSPAPA